MIAYQNILIIKKLLGSHEEFLFNVSALLMLGLVSSRGTVASTTWPHKVVRGPIKFYH